MHHLISGVARSQTTPGHSVCFLGFFFWSGGGGGSGLGVCSPSTPSKFLHLEVATQIVLETIFEMGENLFTQVGVRSRDV